MTTTVAPCSSPSPLLRLAAPAGIQLKKKTQENGQGVEAAASTCVGRVENRKKKLASLFPDNLLFYKS
jgi:hypothetical protein